MGLSRLPIRRAIAASSLILAAPVAAQAGDARAASAPARIPRDAPYCAAPDAAQLFVAPMGEPFRAKAGEPYPSAAWFARADADHDGRLSAGEFAADVAGFFRRTDTDRDGTLIPDEIAAYERGVPEMSLYRPRERGDGRGGDRPRSGTRDDAYGGPMGAGRYGFLNVPQPIWSADTDIDRAVSAAEFAAAARKRFGLLDKARRGYLTVADLGMTPEQAERAGPCRPRPPAKPGAGPPRR